MGTCCDNMTWERMADLAHAEGVEFTLGQCSSCGAYLVHLWVANAGGTGNYVAVNADFVQQAQQLEGVALKQFMRDWFNAGE